MITKYDALCSRSFDYASLRRLRHIVVKRFETAENFYKALLKMAGGGMHTQHSPHSPLESAPDCRLETAVDRLLIIIKTLGRTAAGYKITLFVLNY